MLHFFLFLLYKFYMNKIMICSLEKILWLIMECFVYFFSNWKIDDRHYGIRHQVIRIRYVWWAHLYDFIILGLTFEEILWLYFIYENFGQQILVMMKNLINVLFVYQTLIMNQMDLVSVVVEWNSFQFIVIVHSCR